MSRLQPHSFVGGSNYDSLGNVAGPKVNNYNTAPLGGVATYIAGIGTLSAAALIYGIVKKKPSELNMGYLGAAFISTLPVATDAWLNNGAKYGSLPTNGLLKTYVSLAAPPIAAIFIGSQVGNYVAGKSPKPSTRKKSWYEGRFARARKDDYDKKTYRRDREQEKDKQDDQNYREKRRGKKKGKGKKGRNKGRNNNDRRQRDYND